MPGIVITVLVILAIAYAMRNRQQSAFGMPVGPIDNVFGVGGRTWRRHTERRAR